MGSQLRSEVIKLSRMKYPGSGSELEGAVTPTMNVGGIFFVPLFHISTAPAATREIQRSHAQSEVIR